MNVVEQAFLMTLDEELNKEQNVYSKKSLNQLPGEALDHLFIELHRALIGLLWQIDDLKHFDDLMYESHFDGTVPFDRAQHVHRILMQFGPKAIVEKRLLTDENDEFAKWWSRCQVGDSGEGLNELSPRYQRNEVI